MKDSLLKIISLNKIQSEKKDKVEKESVKQKPEEERKKLIQAEKAKLKEKWKWLARNERTKKIRMQYLKQKVNLTG